MSIPQVRFPSDDLKILAAQVLRELERLAQAAEEGQEPQDPWLYQAYLEKVLIGAWMQVANGNYGIPRECLRHLEETEEFIRPFLSSVEALRPHVRAAREVEGVIRTLEIADRCMAVRQSRVRAVERHRSDLEREILRALLESRGRYLRRGEIYERLTRRPTPARVSQILSGLGRDGLLLRVQAPAQGSSETSFFALSESGRELCASLGIGLKPSVFERSGRVWGNLLRRPDVSAKQEGLSSAAIITFYGHRRGLGRSLAVAQIALRMSRELADQSVLVIDLTLERSELPNYFGAAQADCLGLRGLMVDYWEQPEDGRFSWLQAALLDSRYIMRPSARRPNLYFLPSSMEIVDDMDELVSQSFFGRVRREVEHGRRPDLAPAKAEAGFWGDFRKALSSNFSKVLIDAAAGLDHIAYAGTILLPDALLMFLRPTESDFEQARTVLGNYLWRDSASGGAGFASLTFAFSMLVHSRAIDLYRILASILDCEVNSPELQMCRVVPLFYDQTLAEGNYLVNEEGQWTSSPEESLLALSYLNLAQALCSSLTSANWIIRMRQIERRRIEQVEFEATRAVGAARSVAGLDLRAKTPPGNISKTIRAIEDACG